MSRGTTRRSAFGRRTRTAPNSSRSVTSTRPSGPPANPAFRLRPTSVTAPGGGATAGWNVTPAGIPAWPSSSERRGAWSEASTIRGAGERFAPGACREATIPGGTAGRASSDSSSAIGTVALRPARQRSMARGRLALRPGGSIGSRQPNGSSVAAAPPIASTGPGSQVSSSVRPRTRRAFQSRGPTYASGHSRGSSPAAMRSRRRSAACSHRNSAEGTAGIRARLGRKQELARRQQVDDLRRSDRALVDGVEAAQAVDLVPEELDPDGKLRARSEDVNEAAAPGELAAAGDLDHRFVAEPEQLRQERALDLPIPYPDRPRRRGQVVPAERRLEERLDGGHQHPGTPAAPCRERGNAGRRLVADELAPLVGKGRARLQHGNRGRVAQPRHQLLGHAVADLGVPCDPADPLAAGDGERVCWIA